MKQYVQIECPSCGCEDLVKNGKSENGTQRYRCKSCSKSFQWEYTYRAWLPEVKEQIESQTLNGSGIRDIARNLGISKDTVVAQLQKKEPAEVNAAYAAQIQSQASPAPLDVEIHLEAEADEFWSFVGNKSNQRWTWYAVDRTTGTILAHHNGRRTDESCQKLLDKLAIFPVSTYYTDNWQSYAKFIPASQHCIGKKDTWKIERMNLNFRTHLKRLHRKSICFSKSEMMHDKVIGLYIERNYYQGGGYAQAA